MRIGGCCCTVELWSCLRSFHTLFHAGMHNWGVIPSQSRHGTARHGTARHGTAQQSKARHGTARHGTAQLVPEGDCPNFQIPLCLQVTVRGFGCGGVLWISLGLPCRSHGPAVQQRTGSRASRIGMEFERGQVARYASAVPKLRQITQEAPD